MQLTTNEFIKIHKLHVIEHEFLNSGSSYEVYNKNFDKHYKSTQELSNNLQADYLKGIKRNE